MPNVVGLRLGAVAVARGDRDHRGALGERRTLQHVLVDAGCAEDAPVGHARPARARPAPRQRVERRRRQQDDAGDDELRADGDVEQAQAVGDHADDDAAEHGAADVAAPAEQRTCRR